MVMEGLVNLRPRRLQALLKDAGSIKVKRLFLFFADRHRHKWLHYIDRDKISLGSGKRVIFKGQKKSTLRSRAVLRSICSCATCHACRLILT